ncbi:hypothetical protein PAPYR_3622 [Paratrimastix pyriformis]|uniref:RING-type E3 ubiquitin transferase n=1 Tax=Paratrimastix pyriformis TaxID=342808 RepID=A0ABQ8UR93_9EUKA|nr:hypothetical protein PAPYR_3622 [Paratrimastix pyriformis]
MASEARTGDLTRDFSAFDNEIRCSICKEYFEHCVQLDCHHIFCGVCVRKAFVYNRSCPVCRQPQNGELIALPHLDKLAQLWVPLCFGRRSARQHGSASPRGVVNDDFTGDLGEEEALPEPTGPRGGALACDCRRVAAPAGLPGGILAPTAPPTAPVVVLPDSPPPAQPVGGGAKYAPMASYVYKLLSTAQLRELCAANGLSTRGDRKDLIRRHKELTIAFNSQLSDPHPRTHHPANLRPPANFRPRLLLRTPASGPSCPAPLISSARQVARRIAAAEEARAAAAFISGGATTATPGLAPAAAPPSPPTSPSTACPPAPQPDGVATHSAPSGPLPERSRGEGGGGDGAVHLHAPAAEGLVAAAGETVAEAGPARAHDRHVRRT